MPPQNMPLCHKDYFKLQASEKQQTEAKLLLAAISALRQGVSLCDSSFPPFSCTRKGRGLLLLETMVHTTGFSLRK